MWAGGRCCYIACAFVLPFRLREKFINRRLPSTMNQFLAKTLPSGALIRYCLVLWWLMAAALIGAYGQSAPFDDEAHDRQMYPVAEDRLNVYATNGPYSSPIALIRYKDTLFASTSSALWF